MAAAAASWMRKTPLRALVVDDDVDAAEALADLLQTWGLAADVAHDGRSALERIRSEPYDVAIVDIHMPGLDGIELCREIRAIERDGYTYVVVQTGRDRSLLLPAMRAGADDFLQKPIEVVELEARLLAAARVSALHHRIVERTEAIRHDSERAMQAARTDALTGAGSRLQMQEDLREAFERARRYGHPASLAIVDIDWFKSLNDSRGHLVGDAVLRRVARVLRDALRGTDALDRWGGEEFVVILPEQRCTEACAAVERLRRAVEAASIERNPTPLGAIVTVSVGVAELAADDASVEAWLARADEALYRAKREGRNRVVLAS